MTDRAVSGSTLVWSVSAATSGCDRGGSEVWPCCGSCGQSQDATTTASAVCRYARSKWRAISSADLRYPRRRSLGCTPRCRCCTSSRSPCCAGWPRKARKNASSPSPARALPRRVLVQVEQDQIRQQDHHQAQSHGDRGGDQQSPALQLGRPARRFNPGTGRPRPVLDHAPEPHTVALRRGPCRRLHRRPRTPIDDATPVAVAPGFSRRSQPCAFARKPFGVPGPFQRHRARRQRSHRGPTTT